MFSNILKTIPASKIITDIPHVPQAQITNGAINHYIPAMTVIVPQFQKQILYLGQDSVLIS